MKKNPTAQILDDRELIQEAFKAYFKKYGTGPGTIQPSESMCEVGKKYVYIRNGSDLLGKYDWHKKEMID